jgi:hypothetical protein
MALQFLFHIFLWSFNFHVYKLKREPIGSMTKHASILGREAYLGFYVWKCPMFRKYWLWANQMAPSKKPKK